VAGLFESEIRGKKGKEGSKIKLAQIYRDATYTPQAVVKVSSYGKSAGRLKAHLNYISRENGLVLEAPDGSQVTDEKEIQQVVNTWFAEKEKRVDARKNVNIVLSAPKGSDRNAVAASVREFAFEFFGGNHDYLFALHEDTDYPHGHLSVKLRGFDGVKLRLGKQELQNMREHFAARLRAHGVNVTASYRSQRGAWAKPKAQSIHHIEKRGEVPRVLVSAINQAKETIKQGQRKVRSWDTAMVQRHKKTTKEYTQLAKQLDNSDSVAIKKMANKIKIFTRSLPAPSTRHDAIVKAIKSGIANNSRPFNIEKGNESER